MHINDLHEAITIEFELRTVEGEIKQINDFALLAANGEIITSLKLSVTDLGKKREDVAKAQFDEDGSLQVGHGNFLDSMRRMMQPGNYPPGTYSFDFNHAEPKDKYKQDLSLPVEESELLSILGVLLHMKYAQRDRLLKKLETLGITNNKNKKA